MKRKGGQDTNSKMKRKQSKAISQEENAKYSLVPVTQM